MRFVFPDFLLTFMFQAQAATMTIAQAFNLAFESWKEKQENEKEVALMNGNCISENERKSVNNESLEKHVNEKDSYLENQFGKKDNDKTCIDEDDPLIDLNSPADTLDDETSPVFLVDIANNDTKDMDENFSK